MSIIQRYLGAEGTEENQDQAKWLEWLVTTDPRPDLKEDHTMWSRILDQANARNEELAGVLHGLRCGGTRIRKVKGRYILRPDVDPSGRIAWERKEDYEELRDKYLKPYTKVMIQLLGELGKESANEQSTA